MNKGTLKMKFSKGFGNNLFQYVFGRLLSEYHNLNYCHDAIPELGIKKKVYQFNKKLPIVKFKAKSNFEAKKYDKNHQKYFQKEYSGYNFDFYHFMFYFEDYTLYEPYLEKIRLWFPLPQKNNKEDLVLHFRLTNRLVWETHYKNFVKPEVYREVIKSNFKFKRLFIVTDAEKWDYVNKKDVEKIKNKIAIQYKRNPTQFIPTDVSVKFMNRLVDSLKDFKPILHNGKNMIDDFNFIRSFDQVMFKNSTFAWWASVLGDASKVGAFGPWKPGKGKKKNRNLGQADFPGWFSWGTIDDLMNKSKEY